MSPVAGKSKMNLMNDLSVLSPKRDNSFNNKQSTFANRKDSEFLISS